MARKYSRSSPTLPWASVARRRSVQPPSSSSPAGMRASRNGRAAALPSPLATGCQSSGCSPFPISSVHFVGREPDPQLLGAGEDEVGDGGHVRGRRRGTRPVLDVAAAPLGGEHLGGGDHVEVGPIVRVGCVHLEVGGGDGQVVVERRRV